MDSVQAIDGVRAVRQLQKSEWALSVNTRLLGCLKLAVSVQSV